MIPSVYNYYSTIGERNGSLTAALFTSFDMVRLSETGSRVELGLKHWLAVLVAGHWTGIRIPIDRLVAQ